MHQVTVQLQYEGSTGYSQENIAQMVKNVPCLLPSHLLFFFLFFFFLSAVKILPYFCPYVQFFSEAPKTSFS